jgi:nucleotide-binding universal stress UspA family protein
MMEIRRILCPIDFSDQSRRGLEQAVALARLYGGAITALHVAPLHMPPLSGLATSTVETMEPEARKGVRVDLLERLREFVAASRDAVPVEVMVEEGNVPGQVTTVARSLHADIVVMGTHGRGGIAKLALGSTAEATMLKAPCPVLSVGPGGEAAPAPGQFRRILCAVDFSPTARRALSLALGLAEKSGGRVRLLHVQDPDSPRAAPVDEAATREKLRALVHADAERWCEAVEIRSGKAADEILKMAGGGGADLIVMGVQGRRPGGHVGTTAYQVVRRAPCPVLTAPAVAG